MIRWKTRLAALALLSLPLVPQGVRAAEEQIHGVVVTVLAPQHEIVVRQDRSATMPAMTMRYAVAPALAARRLSPGDEIAATVDDAPSPGVLERVDVLTRAGQSPAQLPAAAAGPPSAVPILESGQAVPATAFVDQAGKPLTFAALHGKVVVLSFIYTRCRDGRMCPLISAKFHTLQSQLPGPAFHLVEVTLDPAYDRPAVLARYARTFGADPAKWTLLTGDEGAVLDFDARFGVIPFADASAGFIHSERTVVIDAGGTIRATVEEAGWSNDEIVAAARDAANLSSNPFERFDLWLSEKALALCGNQALGFSGLLDLIVVLAILSVASWVLYRVARRIFEPGT
jgi:protein SCO1/2